MLKSRILEFIPEGLMKDLNRICRDMTINNNNKKVDMMCAAFGKHDVEYVELGPGTNRFAVLIDGYVFKIAMDRLGVQDNWAEFSLTQELQPYVTKVYECNGLLNVSEYVTVISKEEFLDNKESIRGVLAVIADRYLLGDVGSVSKNFLNWGYRDNGELVILDFAYIYRLYGEEMKCENELSNGSQCYGFLNYDENFHDLVCPVCGKKYNFMDVRRKIDSEFEKKEVAMIKQIATKVTEKMIDNTPTHSKRHKNVPVEHNIEEVLNINEGDETLMKRNNEFSNDEVNDSYMDAIRFLRGDNIDVDNDIEPSIIIDDKLLEETEEEIVHDLDSVEEPEIESTDYTDTEDLTMSDVFTVNPIDKLNELVESANEEVYEEATGKDSYEEEEQVYVDEPETQNFSVDPQVEFTAEPINNSKIDELASDALETFTENVIEGPDDRREDDVVVQEPTPVVVVQEETKTVTSFIRIEKPEDALLRQQLTESLVDDIDIDDDYEDMYDQSVEDRLRDKARNKARRNNFRE